MPLVTVKSKFQVTIPARLRKGIDLREGDIMEATLVGDGILFRPKQVVDRGRGSRPHRRHDCRDEALVPGPRPLRGRDHAGQHRGYRPIAPGTPQP